MARMNEPEMMPQEREEYQRYAAGPSPKSDLPPEPYPGPSVARSAERFGYSPQEISMALRIMDIMKRGDMTDGEIRGAHLDAKSAGVPAPSHRMFNAEPADTYGSVLGPSGRPRPLPRQPDYALGIGAGEDYEYPWGADGRRVPSAQSLGVPGVIPQLPARRK